LASGAERICDIYLTAKEKWEKEGIKTVSTDEKTGIQALSRNAPDLPLQPGRVCRREYEYTRHGTQCLIANWDVVEGRVLSPSIGPTRTEEDFKEHIKQTIEQNREVNKWRFVVDNLNTHQSEALVLWVAELEHICADLLGVKEKRGILKNMESRAAFLQNPAHRVHFVYTPKHCSWLNQVEIWFGILSRKLLRRGNFFSTEDLKEQILQFIDHFNRLLAKPFKWTYNGKPCKA
jgi:transposase